MIARYSLCTHNGTQLEHGIIMHDATHKVVRPTIFSVEQFPQRTVVGESVADGGVRHLNGFEKHVMVHHGEYNTL